MISQAKPITTADPAPIKREKCLLAGDVGGTKTILSLFRPNGKRLTPVAEQVFRSHEYGSLESMVREFLSNQPHSIMAASFGVAAAVVRGKAITNNIPWHVDSRELANCLGLEELGLINDLEANAYGLEVLEPEEFFVLNEGYADDQGNRAVISAGTGLGQAGVVWTKNGYVPLASQGGLTDFAPNGELQIELARYLSNRYGHASWERAVSGPGLRNIYEFLRDTGRGEEPAWMSEQLDLTDVAMLITDGAVSGTSELCVKALNLFISIFGAEAGNVALKFTATGGLFIGGGISPRIVRQLLEGPFMSSFVEKGCRKPIMKNIPVKVILNPKAALMGAAHHASLIYERI